MFLVQFCIVDVFGEITTISGKRILRDILLSIPFMYRFIFPKIAHDFLHDVYSSVTAITISQIWSRSGVAIIFQPGSPELGFVGSSGSASLKFLHRMKGILSIL